jgi:hypothetical protein
MTIDSDVDAAGAAADHDTHLFWAAHVSLAGPRRWAEVEVRTGAMRSRHFAGLGL